MKSRTEPVAKTGYRHIIDRFEGLGKYLNAAFSHRRQKMTRKEARKGLSSSIRSWEMLGHRGL